MAKRAKKVDQHIVLNIRIEPETEDMVALVSIGFDNGSTLVHQYPLEAAMKYLNDHLQDLIDGED